MQRRKSVFNNEMEQRFSLRKYTIGLCSVCLGFVTIGMGSQSVKADTVNNVEKSSVVRENKMQDADSATTKPNITPTETKKNEIGSVATTAPKTNTTSNGVKANTADSANSTKTKPTKANSTVANSNNVSAQAQSTKAESVVQPKVSATSTEAKLNEPGSAVVKPNVTSKEAKPNIADSANSTEIKPQETRLAKTVNTKVLAESKVATDNQFNFNDWTTQLDDTYLNITGYKGDHSKQIVVPNGADFAKAGKNDKNLRVEIDKNTLASLIVDGVAPKLSNTDGQKIVAKGDDWTRAFYDRHLHDISGLANLDTSNVTNMYVMFYSNQISDLSPLANWNIGNVTNMSLMFYNDQISDLSPLANWNTGNVTNMHDMFESNRISDLSPLANWNTGNVTNMGGMFGANRISDLSPLANWNTGNVTDMSNMFYRNQISDLSPLAGWDTGNVTNMSNMFYNDQISDLSPLANWNTGNVTNMYGMFESNRISDLSPLANWNTGNVTNMYGMFESNRISDLSPLADWNTGNVTNMNYMFASNQINNLSPLANWNTNNVTDMSSMFASNRISDLSPLTNWNTGKVTNMGDMFNMNPINVAINSQSILNKFHANTYKFDNISTLTSHSESKTFNDGSQILLDKNVVTEKDSATLTFKANSSAGNTYQIKIYNPNESNNIQVAPLPTALGTTDTSYQNGYTIITNKFINNGSASQSISIAPKFRYPDMPDFAQYESTSGLITVVKDKEDLGSINITYQNVSDLNNQISAPYIGNKPYTNHTQNTFYFQPQINGDYSNKPYSFIKSAGLTITVPDDVTIDPDTFIDNVSGKTLKATKIADNQYQVVLNNTTDRIAVKGLINVPADKLTNDTVHLPGFGMKYTINTYNDKVAPLVATGTSKELSIIPDLASYHGKLIKINQSKWTFDRNGNKVSDYTSQGFTNTFNGIPLEPAVSTQVTDGVETFDMPTGVNITSFHPEINNNVIDHIDYIFTDGSKQTDSSLNKTPKAIRQMKVYFKNGIQSDELFDYWNSDFALSFDAAYPDGTPIKNFDTFKITGSFSCNELGSIDNIEVAQVMLAPTQKLTDGMQTDTSQDESNKAPNANGNAISAIISNDSSQHQGHLTNPIFYFKYNDLMVPDLSKISASYDNQNKELGSIGSTNIDNNKIHSSIITDNAGQKFIKVQVDGEYYYGGSSDNKSDFNVKIPIINASDALTATKDWSWYILNNNNEAKTESVIRNSSQSNKPLSATVDGNTLSVGGTGTWQIITAQGFTSSTETQGNLNGGPSLASTQDDHLQDPTHFNIYDSIINATDDAKSDLVSVANLPSTQDGKSQFDVHMTGKANLINVITGQPYDATITYSYGTGDNNFITGDQVTDWSKVKSIKVVPNGGVSSMTSLRLVVPVEDKTVYDDVGKTIYMSTMTYGEDKTNTNYTTKDGFAVPEKSTILPIIIKPGDMASAKLTVQGQATVHTLIHYKDANGKDVYVKLADKDKTYNELQDTMKRSDYLQSDSDLTIADRGLLPTGMIIDYSNPTIRNSNNTYAADYANGVAAFDKTAKYDFDGDQVIFEGAMPEIVTKTHQAKETIHYVYRDGRTAKPDKVLTSITLKQTGSKNPFTGEITWNSPATDTLNSVDSPEITGYIADKSTVPSYTVTMDSPDKEVTVTYDADNETADFTYFDDTTNSTLKVVNKSGKSNTSIGYTTTDEINNYEKQGYTLVSDDTDGHSLNFDSLPAVDQHYMIHLKHKTESVTRNDTVTRTIHYLYDDGNTAKPDKTQTVSFNETGTKDYVTGKITWDNDNAIHVNSVITPSITGYTPDKSSIEGQAFKFGDKDVEVTVRYTANAQTATITYIDDTEKKTLGSDKQNGKFNQVITFEHDPAEVIKGLEEKGYVLVSNDFNGNKYQADNSNNVFYVHLKHDTKKVSQEHSANFTVHYIYKDGRQAKPDHEQTLSFTENGIQDLVTQKITWTPADSQKFDDVVTPVITGYTPDQNEVIGQTANFETGDREVTVTYLPDVQLGHINYIDDSTNKTLTRDDFSGRTNEHEDYTPIDRIQEFENKGYELVSNDYPDGGFNFDDNDQQDQVFNVHLKHGIVTVTTKKPQTPNTPINPDPQSPKYPKDISNTNSDVKRTIDYKFKDGKTAQPTVNDSLHFERTVVIDKVTGDVLSDTWTPSQDFNDVQTPAIQGYTPDRTVVSDKNIGHDHQDIIEHVVYSPDAQHMTITYIDDTIGKTLHTDKLDGVSDQDTKQTTSNTIKQYEDQHYKLISDSTNGQDLIFDHNDKVDQSYEVHFVHGEHAINQTTSPKQTIHYVYANGLARQGKVIDDNVQQLSFKRDGYNDEVTGHDYWNAWTPATSQYKTVDSPVIQGYTPDKSSVDGSTVNPTDKDIEITVTYYADKQTAHIIYVDKTTNATLASDDLSGKSDKDSEYNTEDKIGKYESQHYVLTEDETNGKNIIFDHNDKEDQTYYVYFVHGTQKVNRQDTVTSTINYKFEDGKTAQPTVTQTKHFSEDGVKDLVTGKIAWDEAKPQKFEDVATKSIVGYTPDKDNVVGSTVKFGDQDVEVTVTYHNNAQTAKITYIDDTEKKTLGSDQQNGKFDHEIVFEHDPAEVIKGLEEKGYKLVSDNFKPGVKYQNDNKSNIFEVHLVHTYEPVETSQTITETVHYIDANGKPVAPDHVATVVVKVTGTRDKVTDSITWNTPSTGHFDKVISPKLPNMIPDKKLIPGRDVQYGDSDITESVVYTPDEIPSEPEEPNKPDNSTSKTPEEPNKPDNSTSKTPEKPNKPDNSTSKTPEKPNKPSNLVSKTSEKPNKPSNLASKTSEKSNKSSKEVSKQFGTIAKTTIPEKPIDSRTVDNHVSAKTTTKRELPQTGTTANTGIWTGLVSIITSLGLLGASKKRKKN